MRAAIRCYSSLLFVAICDAGEDLTTELLEPIPGVADLPVLATGCGVAGSAMAVMGLRVLGMQPLCVACQCACL